MCETASTTTTETDETSVTSSSRLRGSVVAATMCSRHRPNLAKPVQHVLANITWSDPFYNTRRHSNSNSRTSDSDDCDDFIAAFDIDIDENKDYLCGGMVALIVLGAILYGVAHLCALLFSSDFVPSIICVGVLPIWAMDIVKAGIDWYMLSIRHVAVTTQGVCLDVSQRTIFQWSKRRLIKFDDIRVCAANKREVSIVTKFGSSSWWPVCTIFGLRDGQALVDLVTAIKENPIACSTMKKGSSDANGEVLA